MADAHEALEWLDQHGPVLLLLARQIASEASAQDIVQEAFLRFWRSRQRAEDPVAYLYACTRHCALEFRRAEQRRLDRERAMARDERVPDCFVCVPGQEERRLA
ncbi:MAG TPA: sigma factor, partial [Gemmataceae bacterium]|nr:sigma factor [Gemmataceae bacterium]